MSTQDGAAQDARGPLSDLRVVEMGRLLAGPMRQWGREKPQGKSLWWPVVARNKKSVTCDLRTPEGQDLARRIIERADIVVENFRPGTPERWGLDFESRGAIVRLAHPDFGELPMHNAFPKLSETPGAVRHPGPGLGEHNLEVYGGLLDLKQDEIGALSVRGVI